MTSLYLVRHGEIDRKWQGRYLGDRDVPLRKDAISQLVLLAEVLAGEGAGHLVTSNLVRCQRSAAAIATIIRLKPEIEPRFKEISLGKWDGQNQNTVKKKQPQLYLRRGNNLWQFRTPQGESFTQVGKRAEFAARGYLRRFTKTIIVTHAGVIRALLCKLAEHSFAETMKIKIPYGSCIVLEQDTEGIIRYTKKIIVG